jgi:hypothetical protein
LVWQRIPPRRAPELYGTVEQIRGEGEHSTPMFLIRCRQPDPGMPESEQNVHQRQYDLHVWVWVRNGTPVRRREGGAGQLAVGQTVSAWCSGPQMLTNPVQWPADFVVIESDGP